MTSAAKPLSLGIIGGGIGSAIGYTHYISSKMDGRWRLDAGCFSLQAEINTQTGAQWGVAAERTYPEWREMLKSESGRLDAVVVLTPTPSHPEIVAGILDSGFRVLSEKALATSVDEVAYIRRSLRPDSFLAVTYNYSGYPMVRELRHIVRSGRLGKITQVHLEMPQEGFIRKDQNGETPIPQAWRLRDYTIPTISLDLGTHLHHLMYFITGLKPLEVMADSASYGHFKEVTDNVTCWIKYTDNVRCIVWFSKVALGYRNGMRVRIFGEKGAAEWLQADPEYLVLNWVDGTRQIIDRGSPVVVAGAECYGRFKPGHPAGFIEAFANLYNDIADVVVGLKSKHKVDNDYVYGIDHAEEGLKLFEAATLSARSRTWQAIK